MYRESSKTLFLTVVAVALAFALIETVLWAQANHPSAIKHILLALTTGS